MEKKDTIALPSDPNDGEDGDVTYEGVERGQKARLIRKARKALGLSQADFAGRFCVPIGTLRDWEQARVTPPDFAVAYVRVIAAKPDIVQQVLSA